MRTDMTFSYSQTALTTIDDPVVPPTGLIYSTSPRRAEGSDGHSYFIKGGDRETIFAEIAGCILANAIGLPVPAVALCEFEGEQFAGSKDLRGIRDVSPWLRRRDKIENVSDLLSIIAVDTWIGNRDRNWGNLIGEPSTGERIRVFFIDFEKSVALRPLPLMSAAEIRSDALWPSGELGTVIRGWGFLHPPQDTIRKISEFNAEHCWQLLAPIANAIGVDWLDGSTETLARRATHILNLVEGVWNSR
jgi:hypothetical protein